MNGKLVTYQFSVFFFMLILLRFAGVNTNSI